MTRLVVHAGTHATGWAATQRQLVEWREPLEALGVHLHPRDDAESWLADGMGLAAPQLSTALSEAAGRAIREDADILLVSSERLEDALRSPEGLARLSAHAAEIHMPLTVLIVVRDQLGYLNHLYCERVGQLQMARDFPSFAADPSPRERFDYAGAFSLPIAAPDIDFIAVPYADLPTGAGAKALLAAVDVADGRLAELPAADAPEPLPGPMLVAAKRLLFKRLWRLGIYPKLSRAEIGRAVAALDRQAAATHWDDKPYWGWDPASRAAAVARYGAGNDELAMAVWGHPWGDAWEDHDFVETDLASGSPRLVVDVLTSVDKLVKDLQSAAEPVGQE